MNRPTLSPAFLARVRRMALAARTPDAAPAGPKAPPVAAASGHVFAELPETVISKPVEVRCSVVPGDVIAVRRWGALPGADVVTTPARAVTLTIVESGVDATVTLELPRARRLAALVLNAADEADGTTPLVFHPVGPSAQEPGARA